MPTTQTDAAAEPLPLSESPQERERLGRYRWVICALLFFGTTINYVDRQVLGFLGPSLEKDLGIKDDVFGNINAAFALAYAFGQTFSGRWLDWVGTRIGYALSLTLWSLASIAHAFVRTGLGFGIARAALGVVESPCYPANNKTAAEWFPKRERSTVMGFVNAGSNVGVVITAVAAPFLYARFGFPGVFVATGSLGFLWLLFWLPIYRKPQDHPRVSARELAHINSDPADPVVPPARRTPAAVWLAFVGGGTLLGFALGEPIAMAIGVKGRFAWLAGVGFGAALGTVLCTARPVLRYRQTWAFALSKFITDAIWFFFIVWIAKFLFKQHHVDIKSLGLPFFVIYGMADLGSVVGGWFASTLIRRGMAINRARKLAMFTCALCVVPVMAATRVPSPWMAVMLLGLATAGHQGFSANQYSIVGDLFPRRAVGLVSGLGGTLGYIGASFYSSLCGNVLTWNHSNYTPLMIVAGSGYLVAFAIIQTLAPRLEPATMDAVQ